MLFQQAKTSMSYLNNLSENLANMAVEKSNEMILSQLNELIGQNILIIEKTSPVLIDDGFGKIDMKFSVKVKLKDQELIDELKDRHDKLEDQVRELVNTSHYWMMKYEQIKHRYEPEEVSLGGFK